MSRRICSYLSISLIVTTFVATPLHVSGQAQAITSAYQALPLNFEANQGQSSGEVKFLARGLGLGVFFTDSQAVVILNQAGRRAGAQQVPAVLRISMVGGSLSRAAALNQFFFGVRDSGWHFGGSHKPIGNMTVLVETARQNIASRKICLYFSAAVA
jgi:hypothetical protein